MTSERLLWLTERYPPAKGGMAVSCARHVRGLRRRGLLVDVLTITRGAAALTIQPRDSGDDLTVGYDAADALGPNLAWQAILERHSHIPYTILVGFGASWPGYLATTFAAWLGIPSAVLIRGNDLDRDWFLPRRGAWLREALSRARAIGAVTPEKVHRVQQLYPAAKVLWTPNGIDVARWSLLPADQQRRNHLRSLLAAGGRRVIGLFGDLKAKKRVTFWLEALRDASLLPRIALLIVGQLDPASARILEDPALAPRHLRIPFCPHDELPGYYAACDFVALPSAFEGMPNVLLEAMATGVPAIVSSAGALPNVITDSDTGFVFPAANRLAAAHATLRALQLPDAEIAAMGERARHTVATRFSEAQEIDTLIRLLQLAAA
jgi:glycosyltransferase involved in cell wall biosynthesis